MVNQRLRTVICELLERLQQLQLTHLQIYGVQPQDPTSATNNQAPNSQASNNKTSNSQTSAQQPQSTLNDFIWSGLKMKPAQRSATIQAIVDAETDLFNLFGVFFFISKCERPDANRVKLQLIASTGGDELSDPNIVLTQMQEILKGMSPDLLARLKQHFDVSVIIDPNIANDNTDDIADDDTDDIANDYTDDTANDNIVDIADVPAAGGGAQATTANVHVSQSTVAVAHSNSPPTARMLVFDGEDCEQNSNLASHTSHENVSNYDDVAAPAKKYGAGGAMAWLLKRRGAAATTDGRPPLAPSRPITPPKDGGEQPENRPGGISFRSRRFGP